MSKSIVNGYEKTPSYHYEHEFDKYFLCFFSNFDKAKIRSSIFINYITLFHLQSSYLDSFHNFIFKYGYINRNRNMHGFRLGHEKDYPRTQTKGLLWLHFMIAVYYFVNGAGVLFLKADLPRQAFATEENPCRLDLIPLQPWKWSRSFIAQNSIKRKIYWHISNILLKFYRCINCIFSELRAYHRHKVHFHLVIFKVVPTFYYKSQNDLRRVGGGVGWRCLVSQ